MADLLGRASDWLQGKRAEHLSRPIEYRRTGDAVLTLTASLGATEAEVEDAEGMLSEVKSRDYLIARADLGDTEPAEGDRIVDDGVVWEVASIPGQSHWRWSDRNRRTYRVHVKEVGS